MLVETKSSINQIVVVKGWEGFADRLQALSHCLQYCIINNAAICVDWRDYMWGQLDLDFSDYFEIIGIEVVTLAHVLERVSAGANILPSAYDLDSLASEPNESIHFKKYKLPIDSDYSRLDAEIIVHNSKGLRTWHIDNIFTNLRLKKPISDIICERLSRLESPYTAIHLRGTDRLSGLNPEDAIQSAVTLLNEQPPHIKARQYIISDMLPMAEAWVLHEPCAKHLSKDCAIYKLPIGTRGTHQIISEVLDFYKIKKHDMNIDTLTDFLIICFANWSFGNSKESVFTRMGAFMRQGGKKGLSRWLHGFMPCVKPLKSDN